MAVDRCGLLAVRHDLGTGAGTQFRALVHKSSWAPQVEAPEAREPLLPSLAGEALSEADEEPDDVPVVKGDADEPRV